MYIEGGASVVKKASGAFRRVVLALRLQIALLIFDDDYHGDGDGDGDGDGCGDANDACHSMSAPRSRIKPYT